MAPIRRYLRITKYSVLEVRIYIDNPALAHSWLLNPRDPVLPRVIQAVRPLVLPKLREENERARGKGKKAKGIKDSVSEDDFEVSIFLTDLSTPHSLLIKQKEFRSKEQRRLKGSSGKLTGWLTAGTRDDPDVVDDDEAPVVIREESDEEEGMRIPDSREANTLRKSRKRARVDSNEAQVIEESVSDDEGFQAQGSPSLTTGVRGEDEGAVEEEVEDDKKKLNLNTSYDGFSIYNKILCLVIKRKGNKGNKSSEGPEAQVGRQMLESWVSTQAAQEQGIFEEG